jgi:hypothetical protein
MASGVMRQFSYPPGSTIGSPRRKKKRYVYPGKTDHTAPNLVRELEQNSPTEIVFLDIFEVQLADRTRVRGCFALWKRTRHILALAFEYRMQAELVVSTIKMVPYEILNYRSPDQYAQEQQLGSVPTITLF